MSHDTSSQAKACGDLLLSETRKCNVGANLSIAYSTAGSPQARQAILLVHGYPQTSYSMRYLLSGFAQAGYYAVAADYRGAGGSSMTASGYDKMTMGDDLNSLMVDVLARKEYIVLGHDIGSMVATALTLKHRSNIKALVMMECPQPGTNAYQLSIKDPEFTFQYTFHFFFHNSKDLPELLTAGKEGLYIQHFYDRLAHKPYFLTSSDREHYTHAFARAGRMQAGFEVYRAFQKDDQDIKENIASLGKANLPFLATGGEHSVFTKHIQSMAEELSNDVTYKPISDSMHWVPEENPKELITTVVDFLKSKSLGA
ncbi:Soluble epoxide hydrolase [Ceraceosorus bombacis]|uniref:Soluble epoxide hydrolase n=1 Tax=Ceraceosorus bombacis TaxID=401625 RepID=A0A0P1BIV8_9BASI|nr:Soluble epoxide hydrolase [Ceraceosorus bombacis]